MITIKVLYIKEADKPNVLKRILNIVKTQNNEIIIQPIQEKNKQKQIAKSVKKIKKICKKKNVTNVVLSKKIQEHNEFKEAVTQNNIHIFCGRWLFEFMICETIDYIIQQTHKKKEKTEVAVLTKDITNSSIETVKMLAKEYKSVGIITNNIYKFKYLENKIYNEYGTMITVTNNKRKSIAKSQIIINFDFSKELLNQYNIYEHAIIINVEGNMKIKKKHFRGVNVNNYEISSTRADDSFELEKLQNYYLKDLLEAKLYRKDNFNNIRREIINGHYKIKELDGNNGNFIKSLSI